ncbi:TDT family transporter [Rhodococcus sp. NPDC058514]|uniref:TDT family transporter n=1 Tax=unclassified Rhodococcus (in: high G+C Gram-positive bacteria) TaxID=192944 RepID=UPI00364C95CC
MLTTTPTAATPARRSPALAHVTPNWFAVVMGTGIIAVGAASLPVEVPGRRAIAHGFWALAALELVLLSVAFAAHWVRHREHALGYARSPAMAPFYGALPMAVLTVGAGTAVAGGDILGSSAVAVAAVLWAVGTAAGVAAAITVPPRMLSGGAPTPAWLMPVVPPMVSAATGAALIPHLPVGQARLTMLLGCYVLFAMALTAAVVTMVVVIGHLARTGLPAVQAIPTVWIPLGVIGQSIAAANLLGRASDSAVGPAAAAGLRAFGVVYGIGVAGIGLLAFGFACLLTVRAAGRGLRFSMSWWSFTFPLGACAVGAGTLGIATDSLAVQWLSVALFALLIGIWVVVAAHTARGVWTRALFAPAP